jgi:hypothetical protein
MLVIPALVGLGVFIYGLITMGQHDDVKEVAAATSMVICPLCDTCNNFTLSSVSTAYQWSYAFDNAATLLFAFVISVWSTFFIDFWRRREVELAFKWDVTSSHLALFQSPRPTFDGTDLEKDPVTRKEVSTYPASRRVLKYLCSSSVVLTMSAAVVAIMVGVVAYRLTITAELMTARGLDHSWATLVSSVTAAAINLLVILVFNAIYDRIAMALTNWENHKTNNAYERSLILKIQIFRVCGVLCSPMTPLTLFILVFQQLHVCVLHCFRQGSPERLPRCVFASVFSVSY